MKLLGIFIVIGMFLFGSVWWFFGPASSTSALGVFAVPEQKESVDVVVKLEKEGYVRSTTAFRLLLWVFSREKGIASGGYRLDQAMNAWQVMKKIIAEPQLLWVTTSGCLRREQIGEMIAPKLGWNMEMLAAWDALYGDTKGEYAEGVYFPDTYLLPKDEPAEAVARRFIDNFNAKFSPLLGDFVKQNIKWTTGLKIASLIQREAAGPADMPLISGIIWNRLNTGMKLEIDATMQYTKGKKPDGSWWGSVDLAEKRRDSPYNTYLRKGLPPTPICSPGMEAIRAVLEPEETDCIFYLHDRQKQIHCAATYQEHLKNVRVYLLSML
ncbi:endolytic transglycosylase MltG [Candidatus Gottesmanbacteria bacterium]|nr:endolytic transglycosylase MltG [Candidatus Gottesmanbacteria bacterium]